MTHVHCCEVVEPPHDCEAVEQELQLREAEVQRLASLVFEPTPEVSALHDAGRWARQGWHTLHCWHYWTEDPERGCVCVPETSQ